MLQNGVRVVGLPRDIVVRQVYYENSRLGFWLILESSEYEEVLEGSLIPEEFLLMEVVNEKNR
jgi:hypothetical protein